MSSAPLVPAECDLRNFQFMPFDVQRLLTSETWILGTGDERAAAITLWMESWHQIPAGSLPNNDRMLAHLSQAGTKWKRVKAHALRGWVEASDGRLYHPVVAEKALEAWIEKLSNSISGATGNAKRWGVEVDVDSLRMQFLDAVRMLREIAPQSPALKKKIVATIAMASPPDGKINRPPMAPPSPPVSPPDRKGQRRDRDREDIGSKAAASQSPPEARARATDAAADPVQVRVLEIVQLLRSRGAAVQTSNPQIRRWAEQGVTDAQLLTAYETAEERRAAARSSAPINAGFLDSILSDIRAGPAARAPRRPASRAQRVSDWMHEAAESVRQTERPREIDMGVIDASDS